MAVRLTAALDGAGKVIAADTLDHLEQRMVEVAADPPSAIAIHGGDGTLHKVLSALVRAWQGRPLPPVAVLRGGTMNVVASSLGLTGRPEAVVASLAAAARSGRELPVIERRCLRVSEIPAVPPAPAVSVEAPGRAGDATYGFVFGNGLMANFLEEYYSRDVYGPGRAVWMLSRTFGSALINGPYARKIFRRFEGQVLVDGKPLPWGQLTGVGAATVREVGLGFKLNHRADDDLQRFGFLAIHASALSLARDLAAVHRGQGISPKRAYSDVASHLRVDPAGKESVYTIDGDLYRTRGVLEVALGPLIRFYKPS